MKTDPFRAASHPADDTAPPFESLLHRAPRQAPRPPGVDGLVLGVLTAIDTAGRAQLRIDCLGLEAEALCTLVPLAEADVGRTVVLGFDNGERLRPMILGFMLDVPAAPVPHLAAGGPLEVVYEGGRAVIEARDELELRCGESVIVLRADGHIELRGRYVTSHATASQRIRGGSVHIN